MRLQILIGLLVGCVSCGGDSPKAEPDLGVDLADMSPDVSTDMSVTDLSEDIAPDLPQAPPEPPAGLTRWLTGSDADVQPELAGPGLILMGGSVEPDEAFEWWTPLIGGGDVVVIRVSGSDGYNDYLYSDIGGIDSVETLKVDSRELAEDPYVAWQIDRAEGVFIAGGDQNDYITFWKGTALNRALQRVHDRGGVVGGTSAGLAVLGDRVFSAAEGSVYSDEALEDPFNQFMTFEDDFLTLPELENVVTDSHFSERDRMGRLMTFVARMWTDGFQSPVGIGVDESTTLLIGPEGGTVVGDGAVYEVSSTNPPDRCQSGLTLEYPNIQVTRTTVLGSDSYTTNVVDGVLQD